MSRLGDTRRDRGGGPEGDARHWLWHAAGLGLTAYGRTAFALESLGADVVRFVPGTLFVGTHRAETDVPVLVASVYVLSGSWRDGAQRLHFAARDDLFDPGFFAGFPPALPRAARRALYGVGVGRFLPMARIHPLGSASTMTLAHALRLVPPGTALEALVAPPLAGELARRAAAAGLPLPRTAGEALRGELADVLWQAVTRAEVPAPEPWAARTAEARRHLERLVEVIRERLPLMLFPEGRPSPDGSVGPVLRGIGLLVRRGRPERIRPVGIAYDPLVGGRTRAFVSFLDPLPAPDGPDVEGRVLAALRLAMPLTAGSFAAHELAAAARAGREPAVDELAAGVAAAVEAARAEGRNVERALAGPRRRERLHETLAALRRRGLLEAAGGSVLRLHPDRLLSDPVVRRLEREYASAREG